MSKIYKSVEELIGNTPIIELTKIEKKYGLEARLLAKLEYLNPAGSAKDRVAAKMLDDAEEQGLIGPGSVIIEPTSGNTGIGLAAVGASRGYRVIIVMPDNMSQERKILMTAYGAELVLSDGKGGMTGAIKKADELAAKIPGSFIPGQFTSPSNPKAHFESTGPEIYRDTDGEVDIFVAGVGTGGTITGTGRYLKSVKPEVKIIGIEPAGSPVISGGKPGSHGLQGIGAGFIPDILDVDVLDEVVTVTDEEAYETGKMLGRAEGILCGITSGAALYAALEEAKKEENKGKTIVALLPDTGDRYLSTPMFLDE